MTLVADSGALYALFDADDRYHQAVREVVENETGQGPWLEGTFKLRPLSDFRPGIAFQADQKTIEERKSRSRLTRRRLKSENRVPG